MRPETYEEFIAQFNRSESEQTELGVEWDRNGVKHRVRLIHNTGEVYALPVDHDAPWVIGKVASIDDLYAKIGKATKKKSAMEWWHENHQAIMLKPSSLTWLTKKLV